MNGPYNHKSNTADREISASRVFDAPRELVWTDPNHIGNYITKFANS
ncbi:SRPBCC family protein [Leptospira ainazelensis]|nr:hypothetical protein [Leptospira ainazelensis]